MTRRLIPLVAVALAAVAALPAAAARQAGALTIEAVSTRAEYVSGGDVLVRVTGQSPGTRVERDGVDVTSAFRAMPDGSLLGLVGGLEVGRHAIVARPPSGQFARLKVVNHPITGPLFSGPQQQPFFCETVAFGLGPELDAACSAPTQVTYRYRTTAGAFARARRPDRPPGRPRADDGRRAHRALRRPARARHHRPLRLRARGPLRPGCAAEPVHGGAGLERAARLHVRRRLQRRLPPGRRLPAGCSTTCSSRAGTPSRRRA